MIYRPLE